MMAEILRRLNQKGILEFRNFLGSLRQGSKLPVPKELLTDPSTSLKLPKSPSVENHLFKTKLEMVRYLDEVLQGFSFSQIDQDVGLWSWLSLYYFDQLCLKTRSGQWLCNQDYRYILDLDDRRYYRHLMAGPYSVFKLHKDRAPLLMAGPLYHLNRFYEEIFSRKGLMANPGVIEAAHLLYFDPKGGKPKRGGASRIQKPGGLRRFIDVVQQLDLTYDLYSMKGEEVVALLPQEFDVWRAQPDSNGRPADS